MPPIKRSSDSRPPSAGTRSGTRARPSQSHSPYEFIRRRIHSRAAPSEPTAPTVKASAAAPSAEHRQTHSPGGALTIQTKSVVGRSVATFSRSTAPSPSGTRFGSKGAPHSESRRGSTPESTSAPPAAAPETKRVTRALTRKVATSEHAIPRTQDRTPETPLTSPPPRARKDVIAEHPKQRGVAADAATSRQAQRAETRRNRRAAPYARSNRSRATKLDTDADDEWTHEAIERTSSQNAKQTKATSSVATCSSTPFRKDDIKVKIEETDTDLEGSDNGFHIQHSKIRDPRPTSAVPPRLNIHPSIPRTPSKILPKAESSPATSSTTTLVGSTSPVTERESEDEIEKTMHRQKRKRSRSPTPFTVTSEPRRIVKLRVHPPKRLPSPSPLAAEDFIPLGPTSEISSESGEGEDEETSEEESSEADDEEEEIDQLESDDDYEVAYHLLAEPISPTHSGFKRKPVDEDYDEEDNADVEPEPEKKKRKVESPTDVLARTEELLADVAREIGEADEPSPVEPPRRVEFSKGTGVFAKYFTSTPTNFSSGFSSTTASGFAPALAKPTSALFGGVSDTNASAKASPSVGFGSYTSNPFLAATSKPSIFAQPSTFAASKSQVSAIDKVPTKEIDGFSLYAGKMPQFSRSSAFETDAKPASDAPVDEADPSPLVLEKVDVPTGEEAETTIAEAKVQLYKRDGEEWKSCGKGVIHLNVMEDGGCRLVMRSDVVLKVLLNFKLFPRFACVSQEGGKAGGLIMTIVENGTAVTYALRFQKDADRVSFHSRLRKHAPPTE